MSAETIFRILFGLIAVGTTIYLVAGLLTGRTRVGRRTVERHAEPRLFWAALGKSAILTTGLAVGVIQPSDDIRLHIVFLGLFSGQLFEMLASGIVQMPSAAFSRATQPKKYWPWVAFHAALVLLILAFLIAQRFRPIIL